MLETLERPRSEVRVAPSKPAPSNAQEIQPRTEVEEDDGLLRTAGPIMMVCYGIAFFTAVLTFMSSGEALIAVAISIGFAVMFFTVPLLMMRVRARHDMRWQPAKKHRPSDEVDTYTGFMDRTSAVTHMVIVPVAVAFAFVGFAVIWTMVRP
ncbi:MAG: hypothetical protein J0I57_05400 [Hyphomicrobium sp.]|nr:hypothetical protein [Hyphomicrobium sp.]ODT24207.1 MAG: hypothetical protein ABS54_09775 [Hyphomicrobium sp. SCN 65-11]